MPSEYFEFCKTDKEYERSLSALSPMHVQLNVLEYDTAHDDAMSTSTASTSGKKMCIKEK